MGGQQEVVFHSLNQYLDMVNYALNTYLSNTEEPIDITSRMQDPLREVDKETLLTPRISQKQELDRVFTLDSALLNSYLLNFGKDLSKVKIHTGPYAEEMTHRAGADALTSGNDIYFSSGSFSPHTEEGQRLLLHEAEHVMQYEKKQRHVYKEDIEKAEQEARNLEDLNGLDTEDYELFELSKQDDLIFKSKEPAESLNDLDKDLEDFTGKREPVLYRYISRSGRTHEMTKDEYVIALKEIKEQIVFDLEEKMMFSDDDKKFEIMEKYQNLFNSKGLI